MFSKLYGSLPQVCGIAGAAAVFSILVAIAFKLLSAELAFQTIVCFALDLILVAVPPCHPAVARAVLLGAFAARLDHRPTAVPTCPGIWDLRVSPDMGIDGVHRQPQRGRDSRRFYAIDPHVVDGGSIFLTHDDRSSPCAFGYRKRPHPNLNTTCFGQCLKKG